MIQENSVHLELKDSRTKRKQTPFARSTTMGQRDNLTPDRRRPPIKALAKMQAMKSAKQRWSLRGQSSLPAVRLPSLMANILTKGTMTSPLFVSAPPRKTKTYTALLVSFPIGGSRSTLLAQAEVVGGSNRERCMQSSPPGTR